MISAITPEQLASGAGIMLSLLCAYLPGLSGKFDALTKRRKALVMTVLLMIVTGITLVLSCFRLVNVGIECDAPGLVGLVQLFFLTVVTNQSTFFLFVRPFKE